MIPSVICAYARQAGKIVAQQWYQYSFDGITYQNIEGAAFLLEKEVAQDSKGRWILTFRKKNWAAHNPVPFSFEASYYTGQPSTTRPKIQPKSQDTGRRPRREAPPLIRSRLIRGYRCDAGRRRAIFQILVEKRPQNVLPEVVGRIRAEFQGAQRTAVADLLPVVPGAHHQKHLVVVRVFRLFSLLSTHPEMGWNPKLRLPELNTLRLFRVTGFEKI